MEAKAVARVPVATARARSEAVALRHAPAACHDEHPQHLREGDLLISKRDLLSSKRDLLVLMF